VARLNAEINEAVQAPELQGWLRANAVQPGTTTSDGFREFIANEITKFKTIADKSKISIE
jgi:hypothetical protein